jgi:AraC-like DNA-binding protein
VQGRKRAIIGAESCYYDAFNYLLVSVTLPVLGQVVDATPERPYLCLRVNVNVAEVGQLILDMGHETPQEKSSEPFYIARVSSDLLDVVLRLVRMLDTPQDLPILGSQALREIWYRVLRGEMGHRLRDLVSMDGPVQRIGRSIELLQRRFQEPLRVEELAAAAHMSLSTFHARFKTVTSLSPLQFQKRLRLHEARRLLMSEGVDAATVAHRVGYESPSQFSREYRRLFGAPPRREIAALRELSL